LRNVTMLSSAESFEFENVYDQFEFWWLRICFNITNLFSIWHWRITLMWNK
jgi:hypothetical protein